MDISGQLHAPATLPLGKETLIPICVHFNYDPLLQHEVNFKIIKHAPTFKCEV